VAEQQQQLQQQEQIVTPFAQILHTLHNVHKNYMLLTNVNSNRWRSYSDCGTKLLLQCCQQSVKQPNTTKRGL